MDALELIKTRRSVRSYQDEPVPDELLERMLEAARWAPSARNLQPWKLIVVKDEQRRKALSEAAHGQRFVAEAPVVIAAVGVDPERMMSCQVPAYAVDTAIAVEHLALAATAEGLGTCWVCAFDQDQARKVLNVPDSCKVVALLTVGYPADAPSANRRRKSIEELVCYEQFE